jgi:hypothetical protein
MDAIFPPRYHLPCVRKAFIPLFLVTIAHLPDPWSTLPESPPRPAGRLPILETPLLATITVAYRPSPICLGQSSVMMNSLDELCGKNHQGFSLVI